MGEITELINSRINNSLRENRNKKKIASYFVRQAVFYQAGMQGLTFREIQKLCSYMNEYATECLNQVALKYDGFIR